MVRLKRLIGDTYWRIWFQTVVPTALIFVGAALLLRSAVRQRLTAMLPDSAALFNESFTGWYIMWGTIAALVVATVVTALCLQRTLGPYRAVIRLTREMAGGNFGVRADVSAAAGTDYHDLAANVNALAESLERTDRLRRELVSNLAHEIRTPLTNLQGYLEALRDGVIEANQEALASVHEEVMRLVRLVDALHQLARADAMRQQPIDRTPTDLDNLADQLVRVMRGAAETRRIKLFFDSGARRVPVPVHADSIAQVMRNVMRNAVQYADEGGSIRVQSSVADGVYRFACLNTGPGILPEDLPFIFKRFYRSERAKQGVKTGVGIGLAIAKELIEAHGGRIGAQSKAGWTMVWFDLPLDTAVRLGAEESGMGI
ncbi:MAG TPA: HAMP domain-containing sensor histidine kinase [Symbiobacteriaceae bacterium]|nr:HAMP domain-containing sensor histidine kinase [Symbiobacteriaceae bacterium]